MEENMDFRTENGPKDGMERRLCALEEKGVIIPDPRQVYLAPDIEPDRIYAGSVLYPGTRLTGKRTLIGSHAKIGTEGPTVICDTVVGPDAEAASGFLSGATLLPKAKAGANSHYRAGTLLEEHASTAHCVGLKQSILMYGVTCGSLINFCDILISGGRSRKEHTEVGSGFIHFNYTPWGDSGDKATPSLVGNVTEGVFLDQPRIFLGGMSGMVGPQTVGFGAMTVAGQVVRKPVGRETMHGEAGVRLDRDWPAAAARPSEEHCRRIAGRNFEFLAQLFALKQWYSQIRLKRSRMQNNEELTLVLLGALETISDCIGERVKRYNSFAKEWGLALLSENMAADNGPDAAHTANMTGGESGFDFSLDWKPELDYDQWIWGLSESEKNELHAWLTGYAEAARAGLPTV